MPRFVSAIVFAFALICAAAPARADIVVTVDTSAQRLTVTVDGTRRYDWPVSTARWGYRTPATRASTFPAKARRPRGTRPRPLFTGAWCEAVAPRRRSATSSRRPVPTTAALAPGKPRKAAASPAIRRHD